MADAGDLLNRANSLINADARAGDSGRHEGSRRLRRRRSFLASTMPTVTADGIAGMVGIVGMVSSATPDESDDLPVLTDVVVPVEVEPAPSLESLSDGLRQTLAEELAQRLEQQLHREMPALVEAALLAANNYLQHAIAATIEAALDDFREQAQRPAESLAKRADRPDPAEPPAGLGGAA